MQMRSAMFAGCLLVGTMVVGCGKAPVAGSAAPEKLTLYSIDGRDFKPGEEPVTEEKFHNYPVLGKVEITDPDKRKEIMSALRNAMARSEDKKANCFWPRHAVRTVENGKTVDYVICFQCSQLAMHFGESVHIKPMAREPQACFNRHLKAAGVQLAPGVIGVEE